MNMMGQFQTDLNDVIIILGHISSNFRGISLKTVVIEILCLYKMRVLKYYVEK